MKRMRNKPFFFCCVCVPISNTVLDLTMKIKPFFMKDGNKNLIVHA
jgi:hypothetical protein